MKRWEKEEIVFRGDLFFSKLMISYSIVIQILLISIYCTFCSRCTTSFPNGIETISCSYSSTVAQDGPFSSRTVYYTLPEGQPPSTGWPVVMLYHGAFAGGQSYFSGSKNDLSSYYQVKTTEILLNNSFAVVAPDSQFDGNYFWDTHLPPWNTNVDFGLWPTAPDSVMLSNLFPKMESGQLGSLDMTRMHSAGISSGGYMSSRMAFFYAKKFRSVTITVASFYYCDGPVCSLPIDGFPGELKRDHPPTLFLHGAKDTLVPIKTMFMYADDLFSHNIIHHVVICDDCGHMWIPASPGEVLKWVQKWNN